MNRLIRIAGAAAGAVAALAASVTPALAHEHRDVGNFAFVVGWKVEPAFSDVSNAVQVFIKDMDGKPVTDGVTDSLKVEVLFNNQKSDQLALKSVWNSPGEYNAPQVPTRPGTYAFHFLGAIRGQKVDETFTSSKTTFNDVEDASAIQFPAKDPTRGELATRVDRLDPRLQDAQTQITKVQADLLATQQQAETDKTLAIIGIAVGAVGVLALITVVLFERRRRRRSAAQTGALSPARES